MTEIQNQLQKSAQYVRNAAELLRDAVKGSSHSCAAPISDLNRQAISDLSDLERHFISIPNAAPRLLNAAHALTDCVAHSFSAAMLLPDGLPHLPPLVDIVTCNAQLAAFPEKLLARSEEIPFYSLHLTANKGRGAHALLLNNYCSTHSGNRLIPLALALESHRNILEQTCGILIEICFCE